MTVLAAALSTSAASGCATPGRDAAIGWKPCGSSVDLAAAQHPAERSSRLVVGCASVDVPLAPGGSTIAVHLVRVQLRDEGTSTPEQPQPKEPLLLIAGGPGQSGVDWTTSAAGFLPLPLLERFDLVGFDPRGVGRSSPIRCRHPERPELPLVDLATDAGYAVVSERVRQDTEECLAVLGASAGHFNTTQTAQDIEAIREALAVDTLTYAGWSYGAKLGAEYARQHPDRVRAAVLDAPSDPTVEWLDPLDQQVAGFESSFDRFVAWCATGREECRSLGDVRAFAARLVLRAEQTPIPSLRPGDTAPTGGVEVVQGIVMALYDDARWPDLAYGLAEAEAGDSGTLRSFGDGLRGDPDDSNSTDAHFVIECNDSLPEPSRAEVVSMARGLEERHPLFGRWASSYLLACAAWTPERHPLVARPAPTPRPIVVVGTVHDPATPYAGAVDLTASLGTATLVTWEGEGHTAFGRDDCVDELVTRYLVDLTVPAVGTRCPG